MLPSPRFGEWAYSLDGSDLLVAVLPSPKVALTKLGQHCYRRGMRVNVGQAKTDLSKLLARVEAGLEVEIARDGVPVARLVAIEPADGPGGRFLAARGALAGQIRIGEDFEFTEQEIDDMLAEK
jgi:prevent-host-death family protein